MQRYARDLVTVEARLVGRLRISDTHTGAAKRDGAGNGGLLVPVVCVMVVVCCLHSFRFAKVAHPCVSCKASFPSVREPSWLGNGVNVLSVLYCGAATLDGAVLAQWLFLTNLGLDLWFDYLPSRG